jgi:tetratricopeptide (TPR) repeat protein
MVIRPTWEIPASLSLAASVVLLLMLLVAAVPVMAQPKFSCTADVNRTSVPRGENVVFTVSAEGDVGWSVDFKLPDLPGIRVQSGGTNQSMSVINGKARTSVSRTWYLTVDTERDFTISPVTITSAGGECTTKAIRIRVTPPLPPKKLPPAITGNRVPAPADGDIGSTGNQSGQPGDDIFLTLDADFEDAWVGQQVILTFRYWRRIQPWNNPSYKAPRTEGFWREDLGAEKNYRKVVQGRAYNVTEIRYSLFPTRSGDLVIEPAELSFPEGVFDRFFNSRRSRRGPNVLRTRSLVIKVKDLPSPRPDGFSGIVASRLSLQSNVDRQSVPRGEALGLKVVLIADGFLKGFSGLDILAPTGARMHDASESFRSRVAQDRISGEITVEKVLIPEEEGQVVLPALELTWFDSGRGEYRTARTSSREIQVTASDLPRSGDDSSGFLRNEISRLSDDLAFIHQVPARLGRRTGPWLGSLGWWVIFLLPVLLLALLRWYLRRLFAERRDPAARRLRLSLETARAELAKATGQVSSPECMTSLARGIAGFVADCTDRPLAAVGAIEVEDYGQEAGLPESGQRLAQILKECDTARYGRGSIGGAARLVIEVETLLQGLDEARKNRSKTIPGTSTAGTVAGMLAVVFLLALSTQEVMAREPEASRRPGADPIRLVAEGNQAYTEGLTDRALELYLQAQAQGVHDAVLHFNLGNTYARKGELGQAVASYLRAQRLSPRDRDIQSNLTWVRQHIKDLELTDQKLPLFIAQVAYIIAALTLDQWGLVLLLLAWSTGSLIAVGWYREDFGTRLRRGLLASGACLLIVMTVTIGRWYHEEVRNQAVVTVEMAEVKSGPADNFPVLFQVHDGLTVNIEGEREGWVRIGLGGEWVGWLPTDSVTSVRLNSGSS